MAVETIEYDQIVHATGKTAESFPEKHVKLRLFGIILPAEVTATQIFDALQLIDFTHADPKAEETMKAAQSVLAACGQALAKDGRF